MRQRRQCRPEHRGWPRPTAAIERCWSHPHHPADLAAPTAVRDKWLRLKELSSVLRHGVDCVLYAVGQLPCSMAPPISVAARHHHGHKTIVSTVGLPQLTSGYTGPRGPFDGRMSETAGPGGRHGRDQAVT